MCCCSTGQCEQLMSTADISTDSPWNMTEGILVSTLKLVLIVWKIWVASEFLFLFLSCTYELVRDCNSTPAGQRVWTGDPPTQHRFSNHQANTAQHERRSRVYSHYSWAPLDALWVGQAWIVRHGRVNPNHFGRDSSFSATVFLDCSTFLQTFMVPRGERVMTRNYLTFYQVAFYDINVFEWDLSSDTAR